jgi:hypothetical protein
LAELKAQPTSSSDELKSLQNTISTVKNSLLLIDAQIKDTLELKRTAEEFQAKVQADFTRERADRLQTEANLQKAALDLDCLNVSQAKIDELISSLLIPESEKNTFKLIMSAIFAGMVLVVIVGFFVVALKDSTVRSAIFSNQTGIQFVTLFSLVIAIILFGITEILQAKELSALLGGISGYILGRVTTDRGAIDPAAAREMASASGTNISFVAPDTIKAGAPLFARFPSGMRIRVGGSPANSRDFTVASASATEITTAEKSIQDESSGATISVSSIA